MGYSETPLTETVLLGQLMHMFRILIFQLWKKYRRNGKFTGKEKQFSVQAWILFIQPRGILKLQKT